MSTRKEKQDKYFDKGKIEEAKKVFEDMIAKKEDDFDNGNGKTFIINRHTEPLRQIIDGSWKFTWRNKIIKCSNCGIHELDKEADEEKINLLAEKEECPFCHNKFDDESSCIMNEHLKSGNMKKSFVITKFDKLSPFKSRYYLINASYIFDDNTQKMKVSFGRKLVVEVDYKEGYLFTYNVKQDLFSLVDRTVSVYYNESVHVIDKQLGGGYGIQHFFDETMSKYEGNNWCIYKKLVEIASMWNRQRRAITRDLFIFITEIPYLDKAQTVYNAGAIQLGDDLVATLRSHCSMYYNNDNTIETNKKFIKAVEESVGINIGETKLRKMLGVDKNLLKLIVKYDLKGRQIYHLKNLYNKVEKSYEAVEEIINVVKVEQPHELNSFFSYLGHFNYILEEDGYQPIKLAFYLTRETRNYQGIERLQTSIQLLRDYIKMSVEIGIKPLNYPLSLKREHDLVAFNNKIILDERKVKAFSEVVEEEDYKDLTYIGESFAIVTPNEPNDLRVEGGELSHCVGQYINDVIKRDTKVLFLRNLENINKPLFTIEVKGKIVWQVQGAHKARPQGGALKCLRDWMKTCQLEGNY